MLSTMQIGIVDLWKILKICFNKLFDHRIVSQVCKLSMEEHGSGF